MAKTTFKVRKNQWNYFNQECKVASMRRDDFLNRVLPGEIALLAALPPCDEEGEAWLRKTWIDHWSTKDTALTTVPLALSDEVLVSLSATCEAKRVPRDAFFDAALAYLTARLYEAVVVIKNPRTDKDIAGQLVDIHMGGEEDLSEADRDRFSLDAVNEWKDGRYLIPLADNFYKTRLSYDKARVDQERSILEW
jgi:hypothetical protein